MRKEPSTLAKSGEKKAVGRAVRLVIARYRRMAAGELKEHMNKNSESDSGQDATKNDP